MSSKITFIWKEENSEDSELVKSFVDAVNQIDLIDRRICRKRFTDKFDSKLAAKNILKILEEIKRK